MKMRRATTTATALTAASVLSLGLITASAGAVEPNNTSTSSSAPADQAAGQSVGDGPRLKFRGKTWKKGPAVRNTDAYANAGPMWVQRPILLKRSKRGPVVAQDGGARARFMVNGRRSVRPSRVIAARQGHPRDAPEGPADGWRSGWPGGGTRPHPPTAAIGHCPRSPTMSCSTPTPSLGAPPTTRRCPAPSSYPRISGDASSSCLPRRSSTGSRCSPRHAKDTFADTNGHDYTYLVPANIAHEAAQQQGGPPGRQAERPRRQGVRTLCRRQFQQAACLRPT
jgi:hypothetical protein